MAADLDLPDFIPGARVLIRAIIANSDGEDGFFVTIHGPRPPFTSQSVLVSPAEIYGPDPDEPVPTPLRVGDHVTDERGAVFELVDIRERDDKQVVAMLWSGDSGAGWDYLSNLARAVGE